MSTSVINIFEYWNFYEPNLYKRNNISVMCQGQSCVVRGLRKYRNLNIQILVTNFSRNSPVNLHYGVWILLLIRNYTYQNNFNNILWPYISNFFVIIMLNIYKYTQWQGVSRNRTRLGASFYIRQTRTSQWYLLLRHTKAFQKYTFVAF